MRSFTKGQAKYTNKHVLRVDAANPATSRFLSSDLVALLPMVSLGACFPPMSWLLRLSLLLLSLAAAIAQKDILSAVSFRPPFNSFDADGKRLVPGFEVGGNVDMNENFLRLTPDRAVRGLLNAHVFACCDVVHFCAELAHGSVASP